MKELKSLQELVKQMDGLNNAHDDILMLMEMAYEENDDSIIPEIKSEIGQFEEQFEELRTQTLLSGEYDPCNAIVTIHAGAGGTESCDWAGMLYRMYTRWAERKGFSIQVLDFLDGDIAGIKGVTFPGKRRKCLWVSEVGEGGPPAGPDLSLQRGGKETDVLCFL